MIEEIFVKNNCLYLPEDKQDLPYVCVKCGESFDLVELQKKFKFDNDYTRSILKFVFFICSCLMQYIVGIGFTLLVIVFATVFNFLVKKEQSIKFYLCERHCKIRKISFFIGWFFLLFGFLCFLLAPLDWEGKYHLVITGFISIFLAFVFDISLNSFINPFMVVNNEKGYLILSGLGEDFLRQFRYKR